MVNKPSVFEPLKFYCIMFGIDGPAQNKFEVGGLILFLQYLSKCFTMSCWLVGCFGFNGPLRQYFSLYRAVFQREGESGEKG